jgi:hypothetical protein
VGFVVDKVTLGQVLSEYFGFFRQVSFHTHHLPSGVDTIGQLVADVPSGPSRTPPQEKNHHTGDLFEHTEHYFRKVVNSRYNVPKNVIQNTTQDL